MISEKCVWHRGFDDYDEYEYDDDINDGDDDDDDNDDDGGYSDDDDDDYGGDSDEDDDDGGHCNHYHLTPSSPLCRAAKEAKDIFSGEIVSSSDFHKFFA